MDFSGMTAVVTGAASGMGRQTALGFGKAGANVALLDLDYDGARQVAREIDSTGVRAIVWKVDMADTSQVRATLQAAHARFGRLVAVRTSLPYIPLRRLPTLPRSFGTGFIPSIFAGSSSAVRKRCASWRRRAAERSST